MNPNPFPSKWTAHWIWPPGLEPAPANQFVYFRRLLNLEKIPETLQLRVSADSQYKLFVNGSMIGSGPVLTEPRWQTYDSYDIDSCLKSGVNVIAALVYHYGNSEKHPTRNTRFPSRGGFLLEIMMPNQSVLLKTDTQWKCLPAAPWKEEVPKIDRMTYAEFYDGRLAPKDWLMPDFDDSGWQRAEVIQLAPKVRQWNWNPSSAQLFPWIHLEPRPIRPFSHRILPKPEILYAGEVLQRAEPEHPADLAVRLSLETPRSFQTIKTAPTLSTGTWPDDPVLFHPMPQNVNYDDFDGLRDACLALDAGKLVNGRVQIDVEAPAGTLIDIGYAQVLSEGRIIPYLSQRTPMADQFITSQGRQVLSTYNWRNFRYFSLTIRGNREPVTVWKLNVEEEYYPHDTDGAFSSDDPELDRIWEASVHTAELCSADRLMDNPSRERRAYSGDLLNLLDAHYAAFSDKHQLHKYFDDIYRSRLNYGLFPHTILGNPDEHYSLLLETQLELCLHVWKAYWLLGDSLLLERFYTPLKENLETIDKHHTNTDGCIAESPFTLFIDWADIDRNGVSFIINLLYAEAWKTLGKIARELQKKTEASKFEAKANQIRQFLTQSFWRANPGIFYDSMNHKGDLTSHVSEHANFLAMLFDLASEEQSKAIRQNLLVPDLKVGQIEPSFLWALEGLFRKGLADWALELLRNRFRRVWKQGLHTVPELWNLTGDHYMGRWRSRDSRSAAQGSGVSPAYLLSRYVLGIHPLSPGFRRVLIAPNCAGLRQAQGTYPSPLGPISMEWKIDAHNNFRATCRIPHVCEAETQVPIGFEGRAHISIERSKLE